MKKIILISIISLILIILSTVIYVRMSLPGTSQLNLFLKNNFPKNLYVMLRFLKDTDKNVKRNLNDYNVQFLPQTQFQNLKFTKIKIKALEKSNQGYLEKYKRKQYSFFLSRYNNFLFIGTANGQILYTEINKLKNNKNNFKSLSHNLNFDNLSFREMIIDNGNIYVSVAFKKNENCLVLQVYKSKILLNKKLNFTNIFSDSECVLIMAGGRMQPWAKDDKRKILLSTSADVLRNEDESDSKPQDDNSIYGKILVIDENNKNYEIYSKGHRNTLGLYANVNENIILNTENGPKGGDEINLILQGKNYGWDIASYGKRYKKKIKNVADYKLSHKDHGFEEPIYAFVPSIGITEIIKIPNNFSKYWQDNFLIGSMNSKHLFRVKFDEKFSKILFLEKIFIEERIRDLFYLNNTKQILLALEDSGSIGILEVEE